MMTILRVPRSAPHRRWWLAPLVVVLATFATGCDTTIGGVGDGPSDRPRTLIVSDTWVHDHQTGSSGGGAAGGSEVQSRLAALQKAIDGLRNDTGTGWVGRQDDVTGYLAELSGGSWPGAPTGFMDTYGQELFGIDSSVLELGQPDARTVPGITTTKA